ncbi:hypothetical protein BABINDRAFT_6199 [Babjeviella inositovora NRRL Y-12698]|uniref:ICE2-domain-containing protein n=1 Tax=Babjeviella inositovora NRRL Y-12698 TaxID=984486 RepID=A0A1E3QV17_9ASCO|nr:uncharacterized protein BABINDRAFT_6199 [Babjeviella inositovora NRRL Y-12698]ODQ81511.1 hypothetical protein BABINDRAFT_6199 [Babjeviella inositovora NRRL Y-12698]
MFSRVKTLRTVLATAYMLLVILTIPLAFEIGGLDCGFTYTIIINALYFVLTTLTTITRNRYTLLSLLYYCQHLILPSILSLVLSLYTEGSPFALQAESSWSRVVLEPWKYFVTNSTPLFTISEGLCSLLLIQTIGQATNWLSKHKSDSYLILALLISSVTITASVYFLYEIYVSPVLNLSQEITVLQASMLGSILTYTGVVGLYGILLKNGSTIESSLLFAYIVRCIYEIFPEMSQDVSSMIAAMVNTASQNIQGNGYLHQLFQTLYAPYTASSSTLLHQAQQMCVNLTSTFPGLFATVLQFSRIAVSTLSPLIILNLAYRIGVFYAATRIIPILSYSTPSSPSLSAASSSTLLNRHTLSKKQLSTNMNLLYAYAPCIVIAVYTHLMVQYYSGAVATHNQLQIWPPTVLQRFQYTSEFFRNDSVIVVNSLQFWQWMNIVITLVTYSLELVGNGKKGGNRNQILDHHITATVSSFEKEIKDDWKD